MAKDTKYARVLKTTLPPTKARKVVMLTPLRSVLQEKKRKEKKRKEKKRKEKKRKEKKRKEKKRKEKKRKKRKTERKKESIDDGQVSRHVKRFITVFV